jgi:hypothetical protein
MEDLNPMKRMIYVLMPVLVLALATTAFAAGKAVTTVEDHKDTLQVTVCGEVDLDYIHRSDELTELIFGTNSESNLVEGEVDINLTADLSNNVQVLVGLSTQRVTGVNAEEVFGENGEDTELYVEVARITVSEFLDPAIGLELGVVDPKFQVSNIGGAIFDPCNSDEIDTTFSAGANALTTGRDELQPTGLVATYERDKLGLKLLALPAIVEAGAGGDRDDEAAWGAQLFYDMAGSIGAAGEGSQLAIMAVMHNAENGNGGVESAFWTLGGGISLVGVTENLDVFGEVYFQFGDAYEDGAGDMVDAGGIALQVGAQLNLEGDNKPYIRGIITHLSGDDDAADADEDGFASYESISDLLILEDQNFGVNVRNNYTAIKGMGGLTTEMAGNAVELKGVIGFAQTVEDVAGEDALGIEVDALVVIHLNAQAAITGGVAFLSSSDVLEQLTSNTEDSTWLFTLGANAGF